MGNRNSKVLALPPGVNWSELELFDDKRAIAKELAKFDKKARKRCAAIGRQIAAEQERERKQLLREVSQRLAQYRVERAAEELEEKMQAAAEADREEARRVLTAYAERVAKAFKLAVEDEGKWRAEVAVRLKKTEAAEQKSRLHDERMKLAARGVIRGRRGW